MFASAIVGAEHVPSRLRRLLNVESGLNDGLALPIVLGLLAAAGANGPTLSVALLQVAGGAAIGAAIAWVAVRLARLPFTEVSESYAPLDIFAVALSVFALTSITGTNSFVGAFVSAVMLATLAPNARSAFRSPGEPLAELLKLAALLAFGTMLTPAQLAPAMTAWLFAILVIAVARPLSMWVSLRGTGLTRLEWATAAWFGPKGFASVLWTPHPAITSG